jgi:flavodoxin
MKVLVVYESLFGNTQEVARAVANGLSEHLDVELVEVAQAFAMPTEPLDLIVVGGPTHVFSLTRPSTRADAFKQGATQGSASVGLREWLEQLRQGERTEFVAAFDTRVAKVRHLPGSAAKAAAKLARKRGYATAIQPESFYVEDVAGPLLDGELDRARAWGERLGRQMAVRDFKRAKS